GRRSRPGRCGWGSREPDTDPGAVAGSGFQGGLAAVRLGDGRDDGEAQPAATALGSLPVPVRGVMAGGAGATGAVAIAVTDRRARYRPAVVPLGAPVDPADRHPPVPPRPAPSTARPP